MVEWILQDQTVETYSSHFDPKFTVYHSLNLSHSVVTAAPVTSPSTSTWPSSLSSHRKHSQQVQRKYSADEAFRDMVAPKPGSTSPTASPTTHPTTAAPTTTTTSPTTVAPTTSPPTVAPSPFLYKPAGLYIPGDHTYGTDRNSHEGNTSLSVGSHSAGAPSRWRAQPSNEPPHEAVGTITAESQVMQSDCSYG